MLYLPTDFGLSFVNRHSSFPVNQSRARPPSRARPDGHFVSAAHELDASAADIIFPGFSGFPVLLFWYQDFSGAGGQIQVFMVKFGYMMRKFGLHKGYPLLYYTRGGSRRLILKIRPQWSEV